MDEPLPAPIIIPMDQEWVKKAEPPPGAWLAWEFGQILGWSLRCWPVFDVQIRFEKFDQSFHLDINGVHQGKWEKLEHAQMRADAELVRRVRAMLPAYRVIHQRAMQSQHVIKAADRAASRRASPATCFCGAKATRSTKGVPHCDKPDCRPR